jgi:hypothetical protein
MEELVRTPRPFHGIDPFRFPRNHLLSSALKSREAVAVRIRHSCKALLLRYRACRGAASSFSLLFLLALQTQNGCSVEIPLDFGLGPGKDPDLGPLLGCLAQGLSTVADLGSGDRESGGEALGRVGVASGLTVESSGLALADRSFRVLPLSSQIRKGLRQSIQ